MGILPNELRQYVIRPTLQYLALWSNTAEDLLLGTAIQESHCGYYLTQQQGPALGIYQIEPATHIDLWKNYLNYRPLLASKLKLLQSPQYFLGHIHEELITNLAYATAMARVIYYRVKQPLPSENNLAALAQYWKQHYNTPKGKGRASDFISNYQRALHG